MIRGVLIEIGERELVDGSGAFCAVVDVGLEGAKALAEYLYKPVEVVPVMPVGCVDPSGPTGGCSIVCG